MVLEFELHYQTISFINKGVKIVANSKNYLKAHFNTLGDDWERPITAIFKSGDDIYNVILDDNDMCLVPWEVLKDVTSVSVSAFSGDLHTANKVVFNVEESGYEEGLTPGEPTPDVYQQLITLSEQTKSIVDSVREDMDNFSYTLTDQDKEEIVNTIIQQSKEDIINLTQAQIQSIVDVTTGKLNDINNTAVAQINAINKTAQTQISAIDSLVNAKLSDINNVSSQQLTNINNTALNQISAINTTAQEQAKALELQANEIYDNLGVSPRNVEIQTGSGSGKIDVSDYTTIRLDSLVIKNSQTVVGDNLYLRVSTYKGETESLYNYIRELGGTLDISDVDYIELWVQYRGGAGYTGVVDYTLLEYDIREKLDDLETRVTALENKEEA